MEFKEHYHVWDLDHVHKKKLIMLRAFERLIGKQPDNLALIVPLIEYNSFELVPSSICGQIETWINISNGELMIEQYIDVTQYEIVEPMYQSPWKITTNRLSHQEKVFIYI